MSVAKRPVICLGEEEGFRVWATNRKTEKEWAETASATPGEPRWPRSSPRGLRRWWSATPETSEDGGGKKFAGATYTLPFGCPPTLPQESLVPYSTLPVLTRGLMGGLLSPTSVHTGFPGGSDGEESICQCRRLKKCGFTPDWEDPLQ